MTTPFSRLRPISLPQEIDLDSALAPGSLGILSNLHPSELGKWSKRVAATDIKDSAGIIPPGKYFVDFTVDDKPLAGGLTAPIYIILDYTNDGGSAQRTPSRLIFLHKLSNIISDHNKDFGPGQAYWAPPGSVIIDTAPTSLFAEHLQLGINATKDVIPGSEAHVRVEPGADISGPVSGNEDPSALPPIVIRQKHKSKKRPKRPSTDGTQSKSQVCYSNIEIGAITVSIVLVMALIVAILMISMRRKFSP